MITQYEIYKKVKEAVRLCVGVLTYVEQFYLCAYVEVRVSATDLSWLREVLEALR